MTVGQGPRMWGGSKSDAIPCVRKAPGGGVETCRGTWGYAQVALSSGPRPSRQSKESPQKAWGWWVLVGGSRRGGLQEGREDLQQIPCASMHVHVSVVVENLPWAMLTSHGQTGTRYSETLPAPVVDWQSCGIREQKHPMDQTSSNIQTTTTTCNPREGTVQHNAKATRASLRQARQNRGTITGVS
eukprot:CAMPEP_0206420388 /NCGR_PEP_ID=MMETSP0324_2-20121206/811_1 /ASSEMBLY_ACC=CAM_ASM_000836 /TAXON_ID=2866 /ORGANISM="Crypthecodinium cohnii, Strain Seligo" /LENGTH=185 /DNA_ID=CAMNT_0053884259 /DNA_START=345 /DNA_END=900 /DNA_ORIENTATION=+